MGDTFSVDLTRLASSIEELTKYKGDLENNSQEFEDILREINANWTSDVGTDLEDLKNCLNDCISCLNGLVIPVLGDIITIMTALGDGTKDIASSSIG